MKRYVLIFMLLAVHMSISYGAASGEKRIDEIFEDVARKFCYVGIKSFCSRASGQACRRALSAMLSTCAQRRLDPYRIGYYFNVQDEKILTLLASETYRRYQSTSEEKAKDILHAVQIGSKAFNVLIKNGGDPHATFSPDGKKVSAAWQGLMREQPSQVPPHRVGSMKVAYELVRLQVPMSINVADNLVQQGRPNFMNLK